jgi:molybdenum cofactor cytidylyltransferase
MNRVDDISKIWAVVLAAGESRRMKSPKLILPFRGRTIIENVILNILDSNIKNIVVVTGAWKDEVLEAISGLPVIHCTNKNYSTGMLSSAICGLNSLPAEAEAAMIFQGDQPEIEPDVITRMIIARENAGGGIVIPVHNGKRGHPLFIARKYFNKVASLDPNIGLRGLMSGFSNDIIEVEVDNAMILRDIDTKEDYLESINKKH